MKNKNVAIILDRVENKIKGAYLKMPAQIKSVYFKLKNIYDISNETIAECEIQTIRCSSEPISDKRYEIIVSFYYEDFVLKYMNYINNQKCLSKEEKVVFNNFIVEMAKQHYISILKQKNKKSKKEISNYDEILKLKEEKKLEIAERNLKIFDLEKNNKPYTSYTYQYVVGYHPTDRRKKSFIWINKKGLKINIGDKVLCDTKIGSYAVVVTDIYYSTYKIKNIKEVIKSIENTDKIEDINENIREYSNTDSEKIKIGDIVKVVKPYSVYYKEAGIVTEILNDGKDLRVCYGDDGSFAINTKLVRKVNVK